MAYRCHIWRGVQNVYSTFWLLSYFKPYSHCLKLTAHFPHTNHRCYIAISMENIQMIYIHYFLKLHISTSTWSNHTNLFGIPLVIGKFHSCSFFLRTATLWTRYPIWGFTDQHTFILTNFRRNGYPSYISYTCFLCCRSNNNLFQ